jgi:hypothetical protein
VSAILAYALFLVTPIPALTAQSAVRLADPSVFNPESGCVLLSEHINISNLAENIRVQQPFAESFGVFLGPLTPQRRVAIARGAGRQESGMLFRCWHFQSVFVAFNPQRHKAKNVAVVRGSLPKVFRSYLRTGRFSHNEPANSDPLNSDVGTQLPLGGLPSDAVGLKGEEQSRNDQQTANATKPIGNLRPLRGLGSRISRLPLGAQIAVSLLISGIALGLIFRAMSPFGQLVIRRRDILAGVSYGIGGLVLLGVSGWVWSLSG